VREVQHELTRPGYFSGARDFNGSGGGGGGNADSGRRRRRPGETDGCAGRSKDVNFAREWTGGWAASTSIRLCVGAGSSEPGGVLLVGDAGVGTLVREGGARRLGDLDSSKE
jgi:hypothetical protein